MFFKSLYKTPSGILIKSGILEEMLSGNLAIDEVGRGDELHIYLNTLSQMIHLFIVFRDIHRIRRMDSHAALLFEETV